MSEEIHHNLGQDSTQPSPNLEVGGVGFARGSLIDGARDLGGSEERDASREAEATGSRTTSEVRSALGGGIGRVGSATGFVDSLTGGGHGLPSASGSSVRSALDSAEGLSADERTQAKRFFLDEKAANSGKTSVGEAALDNMRAVAQGDYGFMGAAKRFAKQTEMFKGAGRVATSDTMRVFGSSALGKAADLADVGLAQGVLEGDVAQERPSDANMGDRMSKQASRSAKRAGKGVARAALRGGSPLDVALEAAGGAADSKTIDTARGIWRTGRMAKRVGSKIIRKSGNPIFKAVGKAAPGNPSGISGAIKKRYAQTRSMRLAHAVENGKLARGMTATQRLQAVSKAVREMARKLVAAFRAKLSAVIGAAVGPAVAILVPILLLILLLFMLVGANEANKSIGSLDGVAAQVAAAMKQDGFTNEAIAGVLANLENESGMDPASDEVMDGMFNYKYERACGLFQYTYASNMTPPDVDYSYGGSQEYTRYKHWAADNGKNWADATVQIEWTFSGEQEGYFANRYGTNLASGGYYSNSPGYSEVDGNYYGTPDEFKNATDAKVAAYSWMACYEKPANGPTAHLDSRLAAAEKYLQMLNSSGGGGQEYSASSEQQRAIVDATQRVPSPGGGLCAMWVSQVYSAAGLGYPGGNANDMYWNYCWSSDRSQLKVGMIVAVPSWTGTSAGQRYGHVGIYIGDGNVISNKGWIDTESLDSFINTYGTTYTVKWGFAGGVAAN